jgi:hypothetical protein
MGEPELVGTEEQGSDASSTTSVQRRRRRSSPRSSARVRHRRLRAVYFSLAALWGFLTGTGAVLIGLAAVGRPTGMGARGSFCVICAAAVALIGGLVVAMAYRSATRRHL